MKRPSSKRETRNKRFKHHSIKYLFQLSFRIEIDLGLWQCLNFLGTRAAIDPSPTPILCLAVCSSWRKAEKL